MITTLAQPPKEYEMSKWAIVLKLLLYLMYRLPYKICICLTTLLSQAKVLTNIVADKHRLVSHHSLRVIYRTLHPGIGRAIYS